MKRVLKAVLLMLLLLMIYYVLQGTVTTIFAIVQMVPVILSQAATAETLDPMKLTTDIMGRVTAMTPWILLVAVAVTLPLYYLFYHKRRDELFSFIRVKGLHPVTIPVLIVLALALNVVIEDLLAALQQLPALKGAFDKYGQTAEAIFAGGFVPTLIAVGIVGPIFEELLFRGLLFGELRKLTHIRVALVIQALLFGIYHLNAVQGSYAFVIGLLLGFVYYRSGSILAPIIVHITVNSSSVLLEQFVPANALSQWDVPIFVASILLLGLALVFTFTHRSFKHTMDNSLYIKNRRPAPSAVDGPPSVNE